MKTALEERGCGVPGWLLRYLYRPLILPTAAKVRRAVDLRQPPAADQSS